jgi:PAS domain S-box-containing protein
VKRHIGPGTPRGLGEKPNGAAISADEARIEALEQRVAQLEMECSAERGRNRVLRLSLESLGEGLVVTDIEGRFLIYNQAARRIVGMGPSSAPPSEWPAEYGLFGVDGRTPLDPDELPVVRALADRSFDDLVIYIRNEGQPRGIFINCVGRALRDEAHNIVGAVVSFQDITEQHRTRTLLRNFYAAAEQSRNIIMVVDREARIEYANPCAYETFQHPLDEVVGQSIFEFAGEALEELERVWRILQETGEYQGNTFGYRKDGSQVLLSGAITPIRDDGNAVTHWLGVLEDTTERQRAERERQELEGRFRRLVESNIIGVIMAETSGRVAYANDEFLRIVGYSREALESGSLDWQALTPPADWPQSEAAARAVRELGAAAPFEKHYVHQQGHLVPVLVGVARIPSSDRTIAFVLDQSEQKRAELELKATAAELARPNADLQQFAYIVSHDLQEPLRMVNGFLQILRRRHADELSPEAARLVEHATEGAAAMQGLIKDLLDYSAVDRADRRREMIDATQAFDAAVANLRARIEEADAEVAHGRLPRVWADGAQLVQLFQNLIGNAVKFRRPGVCPRVRVTARRIKGEWQFAVRDNGIGIDPRQHRKIFTIFQRLNPRSLYPGTGIGLAIAKKIVERHGGRVWLESSPGKGSTFFFTLPGRKGSDATRLRKEEP